MRALHIAGMIGLLTVLPGDLHADSIQTHSKNMYGMPGGLIDMPTAEVAPDGDLGTTISHFRDTTRNTLSFQILPRLTAAFRYSALRNLNRVGATIYDRSFDLRYQLVTEGNYRPSLAVGLRDFMGTGVYSAEYLVATKNIGATGLRLSGGVGWGRLGSFGSFATSGTRPSSTLGQGGIPTYDRWFRGPVSAFGGLSYQLGDKLSLKAEYSSDAYAQEAGGGAKPGGNLFKHRSPWNLGIDYQLSRTLRFGAYYMHGSEVGVNVTVALDPKDSPVWGGTDPAPLPVSVRPQFSAAELGWVVESGRKAGVQQAVSNGMAAEGMALEGIRLEEHRVRVVLRNERWDIGSQAVGRAARVLTRNLPASVEIFEITQVSNGMPLGAVTLYRRDLELLENAPAAEMLPRVSFGGGANAWSGVMPMEGQYPRFEWSLGPYAKMSVFDPASPVRFDLGARLDGEYFVAPGWVASGAVSVKALGNVGDQVPSSIGSRPKAGTLPVVRSDVALYSRGNDPKIDYLTVAKYDRMGSDWYTRFTLGYLEPMYAGASAEVLWKPVDSSLALGVELNYAAKRDYDQLFGVQDYQTANGHISAYYDLGNGFHTQIDAGRYLAGDWGATLALDREFGNGWSVGAYVTKTNVSAEAFGEGSFDKGIRFTVPLSWAVGSATRYKRDIVIQSLSRNGGARLNVNDRLYEVVRDAHQPEMAKTWGRFWR